MRAETINVKFADGTEGKVYHWEKEYLEKQGLLKKPAPKSNKSADKVSQTK